MKIRANGIDIHCVIEGEGPWLVMSHSLACNLHMWDEEARRLSSRYKVLRYDTRGHGQSDAPSGAYSFEMLADDLHGVLGALGIRSTHFVGLSMGGMIGQCYALRYPGTLASLALCDTASCYPAEVEAMWQDRIRTAETQGMEALVAPTVGRWFTPGCRQRRPEAMDKAADMIRTTPLAGYVGCCHAIPKINFTARLKEIACPAVVIVGEQDGATPVAMAAEIQRALPGSTLAVIPGAAHISNMEQPDAFNRALDKFLATATS